MNLEQLNSYDFDLPEELIAQTAVEPRDHSKLLVYQRATGAIIHDHFYNISKYLPKDALLVFNNSKVIPARIRIEIDGKDGEILLIQQEAADTWQTMVRPGKCFKKGSIIRLPEDITATVSEVNPDGSRKLRFTPAIDLDYLDKHGQLPLPPYIKTHYNQEIADRYQTIYAQTGGSIAAPTAGLHFTEKLLEQIKSEFDTAEVSLDVGLGTFSPIRSDNIKEHNMHSENYSITETTASKLNQAQANGQQIVCVGTTSTRTLEAQLKDYGEFKAGHFSTDIFIYPGYEFEALSGLITNFHLPKSSLFILISAWLGNDEAHRIYQEAIGQRYRFYSFGDSCLFI